MFLPYAYTCDVVKHYFYFLIKIKIDKHLPSPMPSFAELGVEDIAIFCLCNLLSLHASKSKYMKFGGSKCSFSWLGQKVNIVIAGVALTGGGDFGPR